ncbi:hypothetical protein CMI42_03335 [Candidatus Pacearchaeota archaeon]|nr:hypothetical protein [Candidatus Pacearchaeota archaeon]|tara:strand:+ start:416 stop:622 length:207 start_codon:yes stop_codon:yes gene_type:complete
MEQIQKSDVKKIMGKLARLQEDVDYLKEHIVDEDIVTEEDKRYFTEYEGEKEEGRLISEEQLKKELEL